MSGHNFFEVQVHYRCYICSVPRQYLDYLSLLSTYSQPFTLKYSEKVSYFIQTIFLLLCNSSFLESSRRSYFFLSFSRLESRTQTILIAVSIWTTQQSKPPRTIYISQLSLYFEKSRGEVKSMTLFYITKVTKLSIWTLPTRYLIFGRYYYSFFRNVALL